ncbi:MAG: hypothetical protein DMG11_07885 [Acidobacteria bacterium]|nr:MAG: hypothetical protein DMG11_07885 [Acidobacteriota bacterium]
MRWAFLCAFVSLCLCAGLAPQAQAGIDLAYQPMRVDLRLTPGQTQTGVVQLKNQGTQAIHLRGRMMDFVVSDDNTPQFVARTDENYSCRSWTILNPVEVDIAPDSVVPFRYTVQVPATLVAESRTFRCALTFESMPTLEDRIQKRTTNQVRLVTVLYATVGSPAATPEIGNPEIRKTEDAWRLEIPFSNAGETHYRLNGQVFIKDHDNHTIETLEMDSSPIQPATSVHVGFDIKALPQGEYTMLLQLNLGSKILEKEAIVEVLPSR